jgi:hypothetical protein
VARNRSILAQWSIKSIERRFPAYESNFGLDLPPPIERAPTAVGVDGVAIASIA